MPKVKCADCGLLAVVRECDYSLAEVPQEFRETGTVNIRTWVQKFHAYPLCVARAVKFQDEHPDGPQRHAKSINGPELVQPILNKVRSCDSFVEWTQGFSPREHIEMINQEKQIAWEREREEIIDRRERERDVQQLKRDEIQRKWRQDDRRSDAIRLIVAAAVGIIGTLATLIAANKLPWFG